MPGPSDTETMDVQQSFKSQIAPGESHDRSSSLSEQQKTPWNVIDLENSEKAVKDTNCPFMKTPLELRNQIYQYLLSTKYTKVDFTDEEPEFCAGRLSSHLRAERVYQFHPAILAVNRQTNQEAGHILRENLFVKLTTIAPKYGLEHLFDLGLRVVAQGDKASRVTYAASEINFGARLIFDERLSVYLFPVDEMDTFCHSLMRHVSGINRSLHHTAEILSGSSLSVSITGVATTTTSILKLLEPLRRFHSLASVKIVGPVGNEYRSILIDQMLKLPDVDAVVQKVQEAAEEGDRATSNKDYIIAVSKYKGAIEDTLDYSKWLGYQPTSMFTRGKHSKDTYFTIFWDIWFDLYTKLADIHLKIQRNLRAQEWITCAVQQISPNDPISVANANVYSIAAQASERLGMVGRAVEEMKEAVRQHPQDPRLAMELSRLQGKMQGGDMDLPMQEGVAETGVE